MKVLWSLAIWMALFGRCNELQAEETDHLHH